MNGMKAIFKKLNYKEQELIYVLHAPQSFEKEMDEMRSLVPLKTSLTSAKTAGFFLAFVKTKGSG